MKFLKKAKANKENEINIEVKHDNTLGRKLIKETAEDEGVSLSNEEKDEILNSINTKISMIT